MSQTPFPEDFQQWVHCITVDCGLPLTSEYVAERLSVWRNPDSAETKRFRKLYGDDYWRAMTGWFERAETELAKRPQPS